MNVVCEILLSIRIVRPHKLTGILGWVIVALLLVLQWAMFVRFTHRELLGAYPTGHDQAVYLSQTYEVFDFIAKEGLSDGVRHGLFMRLPQGTMLHVQGALLMLLGGPNRVTALSLNFIYFAVLECVVIYTLLWLTKRWSFAFLGLGLLLTTRSRFLLTGGVVDFRLDHIAFCLFGVFVCLAVRSRVFASRGWSIAAACAAALLILFRFQAALTLGASLAVLLTILCFMAWRGDAGRRTATLERIRGLLLAGALIALITLPAIWLAWESLLGYYFGAASQAQERAAEHSATGLFLYWAFYGPSLLYHLGPVFCALALLMVAAMWVFRNREACQRPVDPYTLLFLGVMLLVPLAVLTIYPVRNTVVVNVVITPALGLLMATVSSLAGRTTPRVIFAVLALASGVCMELAMSARGVPHREPDTVRNVNRLYDEIAVRSRERGWTAPRVSIDRVQEYFFHPLATVRSYERHGLLLRPHALLGTGLQAPPLASALEAIRNSDIAIVTDPDSPEGPGFAYPFNLAMKQAQAQLRETAERYLEPAARFQAFSHRFTLYIRPVTRNVAP